MSAIAQRAGRGRRGRVVIVGDVAHEHRERLDVLLAQPAERLDNMFEAIGQIASAGAGETIAAVIIAERGLASPGERSVEALKRVDPAVRVLGFTEAAESPGGMSNKSIDAWLTSPLQAEELKRAMDDDGLLASATQPNPSAAAAVSPGAAASPAAEMHSPPTPPGVIELSDDEPAVPTHAPSPQTLNEPALTIAAKPVPPVPAPTAPPVSPPASASAAPLPPSRIVEVAAPAREAVTVDASISSASHIPPTPAASIGDTDLLHAMMHNRAGLTPLALKLIAHHTGLNNVRLVNDVVGDKVSDSVSDQSQSNAANAASVAGIEIALGARRFGRLAADHASPALLRSWADWLAHWLNIEAEFSELRQQANTDELTGACNRRCFERFLTDAIARARPMRRPVTVMVFDIDNFKPYNDRFGHEAGDDILREIVRLMQSVVRQGDIVCRIGGDEFAVVFADPEAPRTPGSTHPESVESIARRFQHAVCSMRFPKLGQQALGTLSVSAGLASFPWDGQDVATLLRLADHRALESKRKGKNAITFGPETVG